MSGDAMTFRVMMLVCALGLYGSYAASAKSLTIGNGTDQTISSMSIDGEGRKSGQKKPRKDFAIGLAVAPGKIKGRDDEKTRSGKDVEIGDVAEEDCLANLTFTLADGKTIHPPTIDLCNLDGILVEDVSEQPTGNATASP
jgi:hypothetical protein